jgi:hypothetical protein
MPLQPFLREWIFSFAIIGFAFVEMTLGESAG